MKQKVEFIYYQMYNNYVLNLHNGFYLLVIFFIHIDILQPLFQTLF
jgi:hypothetical protein